MLASSARSRAHRCDRLDPQSPLPLALGTSPSPLTFPLGRLLGACLRPWRSSQATPPCEWLCSSAPSSDQAAGPSRTWRRRRLDRRRQGRPCGRNEFADRQRAGGPGPPIDAAGSGRRLALGRCCRRFGAPVVPGRRRGSFRFRRRRRRSRRLGRGRRRAGGSAAPAARRRRRRCRRLGCGAGRRWWRRRLGRGRFGGGWRWRRRLGCRRRRGGGEAAVAPAARAQAGARVAAVPAVGAAGVRAVEAAAEAGRRRRRWRRWRWRWRRWRGRRRRRRWIDRQCPARRRTGVSGAGRSPRR